MDSKRKANGNATPDTDDRAAKRRRLAESYDLSKGESSDSTTAYGLSLVDQIRRTADKSGRRVSGYFEKLPPKEGNADYYKQTRMPISIGMIERKLKDGEFKNLSELEGYFKRMIANAKEYFPRSSSTFDDAERVRKAVSNYMTKTNPAYQDRNYQAMPTPLPEDEDQDAEGEEEDPAADEENDDGGEEEVDGDAEADAEEDTKEEPAAEDDEADEDGEGAEDDEDEAVGRRGSRKRSIILKRRGPGRSARNSMSTPQQTPRKSISARPDREYEDTPYKGLSFQQAQEKIVEEMLRHEEPGYDSAYFEPFVNLPPRALKDYYKMISDPLSLKKLQKQVKGIHGRQEATGVSEYKSWATFEEKTKLLWQNAYYFNEEDSEIYSLAQELEKFFYAQLKKAKAVVSEPAQPKIKLKVGQQNEQPASAKKITIHVGGGRGGSAESPAPQATPAAGTPAPAPEVNGAAGQTLAPVLKDRSISASAPSPSLSAATPALKAEDSRMSPAARPPSAASGQMTPGVPQPAYPAPHAQPQFQPIPATPMEPKRLRGPGKGIKDALISKMRLDFFKHNSGEPSSTTVYADAKELSQSATINVSPEVNRVTIVTTLPEHLEERQYSLWTLIDRHPLKSSPMPVHGQTPQDRVFEALLHPGIHMIESHLIAAIPLNERVPGGPETELEIFTIFVNVMRF